MGAPQPDSTTATETATFVFTDIEGSTRLLQSLGARFTPLLEQHHAILRSAFAAHGGRPPRTEGDSFFVVFPSAPHALAAVVDAQRALFAHLWPTEAPVRVRMGLHSGEASRGAGDYVGLDVHRAARIAATGHGGQVVLSDTTRALAAHALPAGTRLRDLGRVRLKDLPEPEHLYQLDIEGLPTEFPPLRGLAVAPSLPPQPTSFVGREREVAAALDLLLQGGLLTLTGPGGTGKTRLSLALAAAAAPRFPDGVHFVPLAPITDPDLVPSAITQVLGLREMGARTPRERLLDHLRERRPLLVLDNFEQVLDAAPLVADLLRLAPGCTVLVTSRAPLRVYGEREYPVPPLALPPGEAANPDGLAEVEAVRLFLERARAVRPDFALTAENAAAVAAICRRLDGLPLAIELAAARIRLLPPQAMLPRLERTLDFLADGARDLPARQRSLRGAIAWSHDLLDEDARGLFAALSVFMGGFGVDEAEAVAGGPLALDGLGALVEHSLVRQEEVEGRPRFWLLETIRAFAAERLAERVEVHAEARRRHARAYLALAEQAAPHLTGPRQKAWLDRLEREHDNLRAALGWCGEDGDTETALRLVAALWRFWQIRGYLHEARARIAQTLSLPQEKTSALCRMRAHEADGGIAYWQGDVLAARDAYRRALDLARENGRPADLANALYNLGFVLVMPPQEFEPASDLLEQALSLSTRAGDAPATARILWGLGNLYLWWQQMERAERYAHATLDAYRRLDDRFGLGWALHLVSLVEERAGRFAAAEERWLEALDVFWEARDISALVLGLNYLGVLAACQGDEERGTRLLGAATSLQANSGTALGTVSANMVERPTPGDGLAPERAAALLAEGAAMSLDDAVAYAREGTLGVHRHDREREHEVPSL